MSKYTTEVRYICEYYAGLTESVGNSKVLDVIEQSREKVFDFDYPLYDDNYRKVLETKILSHYYTREICEETVGLWKHRLYARLNEIMPAYNRLYEAEARRIDPLTNILKIVEGNKDKNEEAHNTDYSQTQGNKSEQDITHNESNTNGTGNATTLTNTTYGSGEVVNGSVETEYGNLKEVTSHTDKYNDTPQGSIQGLVDDEYLTNARIIDDTKTTSGKVTENNNGLRTDKTGTDSVNETETSSSNSNTIGDSNSTKTGLTNTETTERGSNTAKTTDEYVEKISGYEGISYSKLLREFRDNMLNIDLMIINDLSDLFIQLW